MIFPVSNFRIQAERVRYSCNSGTMEEKMKGFYKFAVAVSIGIFFCAGNAMATKPGKEVNPNGFPSGDHFNLNIHGKKEGFNPPVQEYDENGESIYGNSIFVPENGENIEIYMQSGKGKKTADVTELQVIDPVSHFDGDGAMLQLPNNNKGYRVYARVLAKPTDDPEMTVTPSLSAVEDEWGNDLLYLGMVTDDGFESANGITLERTRGKSKAVEITGLFEWTGDVCYFSAPADGSSYTLNQTCCIDADHDMVYESCEEPLVTDGISSCGAEGYELLSVYCQSYLDAWVFNVADFVEYLWNIDNNGSKLVQIRFYPNR